MSSREPPTPEALLALCDAADPAQHRLGMCGCGYCKLLRAGFTETRTARAYAALWKALQELYEASAGDRVLERVTLPNAYTSALTAARQALEAMKGALG